MRNEKKTTLKHRKPQNNKKTPQRLDRSFWRGKKGKTDERDRDFAVSSTNRTRQNSLLAPKTTSLWSGEGSPVNVRMTVVGTG